jgi:hypothetical protein
MKNIFFGSWESIVRTAAITVLAYVLLIRRTRSFVLVSSQIKGLVMAETTKDLPVWPVREYYVEIILFTNDNYDLIYLEV